MTEQSLLQAGLQPLMDQWLHAATANQQLERLGRHASLSLCVRMDDAPWFFTIDHGRLVSIDAGPFHLRHADLEFSASCEHWARFFLPLPPRGFHDILAMSSYFHLRISGNQHLFREHLAFLKHLLALPREFDGNTIVAGLAAGVAQ